MLAKRTGAWQKCSVTFTKRGDRRLGKYPERMRNKTRDGSIVAILQLFRYAANFTVGNILGTRQRGSGLSLGSLFGSGCDFPRGRQTDSPGLPAAPHSMAILWRWTAFTLGRVSSRMPSWKVAVALAPSTAAGRATVRLKLPREISQR